MAPASDARRIALEIVAPHLARLVRHGHGTLTIQVHDGAVRDVFYQEHHRPLTRQAVSPAQPRPSQA